MSDKLLSVPKTLDFAEKRLRLADVSKELKTHFVGLDSIIDQIISKITAWYLFPNVCTRPLIINLWGMTGVGKTDLIRQLTKHLGFNDSFLEIQMASKNTQSWEKTIHKKLLNSSIQPNKPAIILFDEFQRFRSINEDRREILDADFQDIWQLLSDGKFSLDSSVKQTLIEMCCTRMYSQQFQEISESDESEKKSKKEKKYKTYSYDAKQLKSLLMLDESIEEIMTWSDEHYYEIIQKAIDNLDTVKQPDYSKCLIFISGNIDEVYHSATNVSDVDIDADIVHERTSKLSLIDIKEALLHRFKPEQISRLGNIHIVYPSLNRASYEEIIRRKLSNLVELTKTNCNGIAVEFDESINELVYNNGVFPTQGTRPLFSTIDDIYNQSVPHFVIPALETNSTSIKVKYADSIISGIVSNDLSTEEFKIPFVGDLDRIRRSVIESKDKVSCISVHEAGHAVVYAMLTGMSPAAIVVSLTSNKMGGFVFPVSTFLNKRILEEKVMICLAGTLAEELIFGEEKRSAGAGSDLGNVASLLASGYRELGFYGNRIHESHPTFNDANSALTDNSASNSFIKNHAHTLNNRTKKLLEDNKPLLLDVANRLRETKSLSKEEFTEICIKHNVPCKVSSISDYLIDDYHNMLEKEILNLIQ